MTIGSLKAKTSVTPEQFRAKMRAEAALTPKQQADRFFYSLEFARIAAGRARKLRARFKDNPEFTGRLRELALEPRLERLDQLGWEMP